MIVHLLKPKDEKYCDRVGIKYEYREQLFGRICIVQWFEWIIRRTLITVAAYSMHCTVHCTENAYIIFKKSI